MSLSTESTNLQSAGFYKTYLLYSLAPMSEESIRIDFISYVIDVDTQISVYILVRLGK